jgi:hypothetical protein
MKLLNISAVLILALGLSGCMGGMHHEHRDGMMGDAMSGAMMGERAQANCPAAETAHDAAERGAAGAAAEHEHPAQGPAAECPPAAEAHQHEQTPQN